MKQPPIDREALAALLERFGDSISSFDKLRPDSYEHAIARQSLERLELFYSQIMEAGQTQEQARQNCPPWPNGAKYAGRLPSTNVISDVSERIRTASALRQVRPIGQFLKEFRREIKATPLGENQAVLDGLMGALGQKMMSDVRDGKPLEDNLKLIDRLQQQRIIEQNETRLQQVAEKISQGDRRIKLLEKKVSDAAAEVKKLREKGSALSDAERLAIIGNVDEILGIKS